MSNILNIKVDRSISIFKKKAVTFVNNNTIAIIINILAVELDFSSKLSTLLFKLI